jgi:hypothetical protein
MRRCAVGSHVRIGVGHLAFGLAFIAIGATWLLRDVGLDVNAAWLTTVAALAFGAAGLVTVLVRIAR